MKYSFVYIMANNDGILYTGVTNNLIRRVYEHKNIDSGGFTSKYKINKLVYYEILESIIVAIMREKQIKNMHREHKLRLIRKANPGFFDLYSEIIR